MDSGFLVKEVADLCGVSIRLLHHWDQVGLACPSIRLSNGYRLYTDADIMRIQQALVYRETGMALADIKELLDSTQDEEIHLRKQLALLQESADQLQRKIQAIQQLLEACMEGKTLSAQQKSHIMGKDWMCEWEQEAQEKWGDTAEWQETQHNLASMTDQDWKSYRMELSGLEEQLSHLYHRGTAADASEVLTLIEEYRKACSKHHFEITYSKHVILGKMYLSDPRFKAYYDNYGSGFAHWICAAIEANAQAHGIDIDHVEWDD